MLLSACRGLLNQLFENPNTRTHQASYVREMSRNTNFLKHIGNTSNPVLLHKINRAPIRQRMEAHLFAPNQCWFTTYERSNMHNQPANTIAEKHFLDLQHQLPLARIQACDFCFSLPSSALLEPTYKSFAAFISGQGIFFLLKPIHGLWRSQSLGSSHGCLLLPRIWIYLSCLPFSHQEYKHRFNS